jgi:hypothetical protein
MPKQEKDSWFILVVIAATLALYFAFLAVVGMNQAAGGVFALAALTGIPGMKRRKRQGGDVVYDERDRHIERQALLFSLTAFYGGMILFGLVTGFWAGWETSVPLWKVFQVLWAVALVVWGLKAAFIIVLYRRGAHA